MDNRAPIINPDCDIRQLVYAVIVCAAQDANKGDNAARKWILEEGVIWIDSAFDVYIPPERLQRWIKRGCPIPRGLQFSAPQMKPAEKRKSSQGAPGRTETA